MAIAISAVSTSEVETRLARIPFMQGMALKVLSFSDGQASANLFPYPHLLNMDSARIDDGAILAVFDQMGSAAIWSRYGLYHPHATLSLSLGFVERPKVGAAVEFSAEIVSSSRGLCHTSLRAHDITSGRCIAHGHSSFVLGAYARGAPQIDEASRPLYKRTPLAQCFCEDVGMISSHGECRITFKPHLVGSVDPPALHGGILAAGAAEAARMLKISTEQQMSSFTIEYISGALECDTIFSAQAIRLGKRTSSIRVEGMQEETGRLISSSLVRFSCFTE